MIRMWMKSCYVKDISLGKDFDDFFADRELALEELEMVAGGIGFPNFKLPFRKIMK